MKNCRPWKKEKAVRSWAPLGNLNSFYCHRRENKKMHMSTGRFDNGKLIVYFPDDFYHHSKNFKRGEKWIQEVCRQDTL